MDNDLNRSAERLGRSEETRARLTGFGTGKQGQAMERQFHDQLVDIIVANRESPDRRERPLWGVLRDIKIDDLVRRLLTAGITVSYAADIGVDDEGQKNFRDISLWLARNLVSVRDRELAFKVGVWGIERLCALLIFELRDDGILELVLTDQLDSLLNDVLGSRHRRQSAFDALGSSSAALDRGPQRRAAFRPLGAASAYSRPSSVD